MVMRIGRHVRIGNGILTVPKYASDIGCNIFQIFLGSPQRVLSPPQSRDNLVKFGELLKKYKLKMVIHGSYTINLCHPKGTSKFNASVKSLIQDLKASSAIGGRCLGVIIHMGKNVPELNISNQDAIKNYAIGVRYALEHSPDDSFIILETGASQGNEVGSRIDVLSQIYQMLSDQEKERVLFCIDTCHIWATGYDISDRAGVRSFFKEFDELIGIEKISCIHFNDSKNELDSHVDRHADIGYGRIKGNGLKYVARFANRHQIPIILETPLDSVDLETNRDITYSDELSIVKKMIK